jgi:arylsulfatase A-like enzyme
MGAKSFFHDVSSRVPFVLRLPFDHPERNCGSTVDKISTFTDILPTLAGIAGAETDFKHDGVDLIGLAAGKVEERKYFEFTGPKSIINPNCAAGITDGEWKYTWFPEGGREQLFNLKEDPKELKDLSQSSECSSIKETLHKELLDRHINRGSDRIEDGKFIIKPISEIPEAERRSMKWPGYHTEYHDVDVRH